MQQLAFDLFAEDRLPRKPYCSDDLAHGLLVRPLHIALEKRYIQPNPPGMAGYLAFDLDRADSGAAWMDCNAPRPNVIIKNPDNGHSHYLYALENAVCTTSAARLQPLRYLSAIERAIATELQADPGYSGLIIKNPLHRHWQTIITETTPYSMAALASRLDLTTRLTRRSRGTGGQVGNHPGWRRFASMPMASTCLRHRCNPRKSIRLRRASENGCGSASARWSGKR